jgi:hypothetical protein
MNVINPKVLDNFHILLVLKFHDFRPTGLGVIDFISFLSGFACVLYRSERLDCLINITFESTLDDNKGVVVVFI